MFLLMTSYRGVATSPGNVVFLLDEPASNLHSSAQAELLKSFENLSRTCQLIYTTHSHHMININWLDAAFVVKNEALGDLSIEQYLTARTAAATAISATPYRRFVSEHPSQTSYFQPVLDLLEYRPSDLEPVPNVVLVEGKSDFYLLKYAADVLGISTNLKLIPGGGAGTLDPLIRLHIGWGKSFVILLDDDAEGRKQKARYEQEFGPMVRDRCVLLSTVASDASVREIEDLFDQHDREGLISTVTPSGTSGPTTKKALRNAIIELYARRQAVSVSSASIERIEAITLALEALIREQAEPKLSGNA